MKKLSTGEDSTLGNHRKMAVAVWGNDSKAVKFLNDKIAESPNGENEEVIADEVQMVFLLRSIMYGSEQETPNQSKTKEEPQIHEPASEQPV